jgi:hypothetical protein
MKFPAGFFEAADRDKTELRRIKFFKLLLKLFYILCMIIIEIHPIMEN